MVPSGKKGIQFVFTGRNDCEKVGALAKQSPKRYTLRSVIEILPYACCRFVQLASAFHYYILVFA